MFSVIISLAFLTSISTSKSIPSVYIQLFERLHAEITENFDDCTPQVVFHFSTNGMHTNTDWFPLLQNRILATSIKRSNDYVTVIVTDMEANNAALMDSIEDPVRFRYHCSLVFIEIGTLLTKNIRSEGDNFNQEYFQENLLQLTRNVEEPFFIYFSSSEVALIPSFLKVTALTHRKIFVIPNEGKVNVLKQTPGLIDQVYLLQSFEEESFDISMEKFCNHWEGWQDFQGRPVAVLACPLCEESYEESKRLKIWIGPDLAIIDEVINRVNSTLELVAVFSLPSRERNDDGEWDEYTRPLIDGSAAISTMTFPSTSKSLVVYLTRPYVYDAAIFLVSLPRKVKAGSLIVLKDPLETNVWVAFLISIASMICYQMIFEGEKACFVYSTLLESYSEQFLVNIYGQNMYYKSLDSHFHGYLGLGVSKFYPGLLESVNNFILLSESSGLSILYGKVARSRTQMIGRNNAKNWASEKPFYKGVRYQKESVLNEQYKTFLKQLILSGSLLAGIAFALEVLMNLVHKFEVSDEWQSLSEGRDDNFQRFQAAVFKLMPHLGIPFYIYFAITEITLIESFLKVSTITTNKIFLIPKDKEIVILKQVPGIAEELLTLGFSKGGDVELSPEVFSNKREDFQGRPVSVSVCPICENEFEEVKTRKIWVVDNLALLFEALCKLNATLDPVSVFSLPQRGQNEDGEWDEYTRPLIEGSSAIATLVLPSSSKLEHILFSTPYAHDSAIFVIGLPKKIKFDSLVILKDPLDNQVWIAFCISASVMVFCLQLVIHGQGGKMSLSVVRAIIYPIVDQVAETGCLRNAWKSNRTRFLCGLWILSLIVLSCAYKCNLISAIVIPRYSKIPSTFQELSESSYQLGAVLYTGIMENDLKITNNKMSQEILRRVVEYDYISPECYQMILQEGRACLAYVSVIEEFATQFLIDIYGKSLYLQSRDAHFHAFVGFGVSKYFPMFLEPLNYLTSLSNSVGLSHLYHALAKRDMKQKGRANARKFVENMPYYKGNEDSHEEMVDKFNHCSSFTFILEVKAIHFVEYQWSAHTNNIRITKQDSQYSISSKYGANLILDLDNENFHKTGIWEDAYMAVTYEALGRFNVSFETSSAMGIPTGDQNEDGEWDDFTNPLVDGSSAVSTVIKPTYLKGEVIYLTKDYMHDSAIFISAPPLQTKFGSLSVLKDPLEYEVWMGFLISISSMIAVLQAIIYLRIGKLAYRTIAQIVLYPILDQMAFTHQSKSGFSKDRVVNVMVGTWYLSLIVLACAYKSKLISAIVCPHYITRPQNFAELAASKYDIGIVFYTGFLENDFRELNTSVNAEIARRAVEYDYLAEDCYQKIFEGDNVCIGYTMAMEAIGGEFLMDINGQKMYALSKDSHFQGLMVLGVSKYYPMFL
ncbi:unnamed protein product, partial [Allacma fusca]